MPRHVRKEKLAPGGGYENSGVSGDPTKATAELGKVFLQIKIDNALAQIKGLHGGTIQRGERRGARRRWWWWTRRPAAARQRPQCPQGPTADHGAGRHLAVASARTPSSSTN